MDKYAVYLAEQLFILNLSLYLWLGISIIRIRCRGVVPIGRTAVSKTDGWEFESLHPCHFPFLYYSNLLLFINSSFSTLKTLS